MAAKHSPLSGLGDLALIEMALKDNSQQAFGELYNRYKNGLSAFVYRIVQEKEAAEDICMVSFEKAFGQLSSYNGRNKFSTWLYTIAKNTALDHKDKLSTGAAWMAPDGAETEAPVEVPDDRLPPDEEIIRSQDHEHLLSCIGNLPEHYRIVATLCFIDNLGYKEIAEKADIPLNTVKTRVSRARALLTVMMQDMES